MYMDIGPYSHMYTHVYTYMCMCAPYARLLAPTTLSGLCPARLPPGNSSGAYALQQCAPLSPWPIAPLVSAPKVRPKGKAAPSAEPGRARVLTVPYQPTPAASECAEYPHSSAECLGGACPEPRLPLVRAWERIASRQAARTSARSAACGARASGPIRLRRTMAFLPSFRAAVTLRYVRGHCVPRRRRVAGRPTDRPRQCTPSAATATGDVLRSTSTAGVGACARALRRDGARKRTCA